MNTVEHFKSVLIKPKHCLGKKITRSTLDHALKYARTNKPVPAPLPSKSALVVDGKAVSGLSPGSQLLLHFGLSPADESTAGQAQPEGTFRKLKEDFA